MTDEDIQNLLELVKQMRISVLFEEPCPLFEPFEEEELHG